MKTYTDREGTRAGRRAPTAYDTPTLFLDERQLALLGNAEATINEAYCANWCAHHVPAVPCTACADFSPAADGHVACDAYEPVGEVVA